MFDDYLLLDWRNAASPKDIIHRLETDLDDQTKSGNTLRLGQSTAKGAYFLVQSLMTYLLTIVANRMIEFWSQAYATAVSLVEMQAREQMLKIRFLQYREVSHRASFLFIVFHGPSTSSGFKIKTKLYCRCSQTLQ